jgi:AraC-like DNA-binding protein
MKKYFLIYFVWLVVTYSVSAQNQKSNYRELTIEFFQNTNDTLRAEIIAQKFLQKAKNENNIKRIADGYFLHSKLSNDSIKLIYIDSILKLTLTKPNKDQPCLAYFSKSRILYKRRNFQDALNFALLAYQSADSWNNSYVKNLSARTIGLVKSRLGDEKEALEIFKNCYQKATEKDYINQDPYSYLQTIFSLSDSYQRNRILDSARLLNNKGFQLAEKFARFEMAGYFRFNQGIVHLDKLEFEAAIDSLTLSLPTLLKNKDNPNIALAYFYTGKAFWRLGNKEEAVSNFQKTDSVFEILNDVHPDAREGYLFLIEYYREQNDLKGELNYIKKLLKLDSILEVNYKNLSKKVIRDYDTKLLMAQKENVIDKLEGKNNFFKTGMLGLSILTFISVLGLLYYYYRQKTYKEKFIDILDKFQNSQKSSIHQENKSAVIDIQDSVIQDLNKKIEKFIAKDSYLDPDLTLTSLAKEFQTNSSYLSRVINYCYRKNFNSFINDLRIEYITKKLLNDKTLQRFTIKAIAEEAGFKNTVSFSKAFYRTHRMQTSFFLKELDKIEKDL